jgi:hypothetical protein
MWRLRDDLTTDLTFMQTDKMRGTLLCTSSFRFVEISTHPRWAKTIGIKQSDGRALKLI